MFQHQIVAAAAGRGVTVTGEKKINNWSWENAVIFAATVITTIGRHIVLLRSISSLYIFIITPPPQLTYNHIVDLQC